jgi:phenylpropionate dioxygenase-like ring-hydroxylating dioxygenase large terminal subunit
VDDQMITNSWFMIGLSKEVDQGLFSRTVAGERVLVYRLSSGELTAMEDRCSHRQSVLSEGRRIGDDVQCGYHGLTFDCTGTCVDIPGQSNIPKAAHVRSFPVVERDGIIWVWPSSDEVSEHASIADYTVTVSPDFVGAFQYNRIESNFWPVVENFLDQSHVSYVHPETLQSAAISLTTPDVHVEDQRVVVRRTLEREESSPLFKKIMQRGHIDRVQDCIYEPIGSCRIETTAYPAGSRDAAYRTTTAAIITPETEDSCHTWVGIFRDFAIDNDDFSQITDKGLALILQQDRDVIEHAYANYVPGFQEVRLEVDRGWTSARRMLDRRMKEKQAESAEAAEKAGTAKPADTAGTAGTVTQVEVAP